MIQIQTYLLCHISDKPYAFVYVYTCQLMEMTVVYDGLAFKSNLQVDLHIIGLMELLEVIVHKCLFISCLGHLLIYYWRELQHIIKLHGTDI